MNATFTLPSFPLPGAAVHLPPGGDATLLQAARRGLQPGYVLSAFEVSTADDLHPDLWEMHPAGNEVLIMLTGELVVEWADGPHRGSVPLAAGRGAVVPRGAWHRLVLRQPGLLLALTPRQGTELARGPGGRPEAPDHSPSQ